MRAGNVDPTLQQALAGLTPTLSPPSNLATPVASPSLGNLNLPVAGAPFDVHVIRRDFPILHQPGV